MTAPAGGPDLAALAVAVAARLREEGVPVDLRSVQRLTAALVRATAGGTPPGRRHLDLIVRTTLAHRREDLAVIDRVLADLAAGRAAGAPHELPRVVPNGTPRRRPYGERPVAVSDEELPWATLRRPEMQAAATPAAPDSRQVPLTVASARVGAADERLGPLDPAEAERIGHELRAALGDWPRRRTRRRVAGRRGRVSPRRSAGAWGRTGGEPVQLVRERPRRRRRRLVVLCDVSESMRPHVTCLLHLLRAAAVDGGGETFVFGTRVTRLTPLLAHRDPDEAVAAVSASVTDRNGGTRIAGSVRELLGSHQGELLRGAVCVVASDGWDADPPEETGRQVARLARRTHRLVWLNPRAGEPGFAPLAGGMAAALPFCDLLLPAGTVEELRDAVRLVGRSGLSSTGSRRRRDGTS
ncbi:VWA domain-containing protein [Nocardioides humi]|uniref:VWA domain-containing protein n=1 Tax=Nocardioides humi TaxID=449461 RepID=A0ABN2AKS3_9ACTN|nr:VWA domain-containing protein [Nocardioides humi]